MRSFHALMQSIVLVLTVLLLTVLDGNWSAVALGQAGLRESLERLDVDQDGEIEPDEITPLARPYLERITRARRMSLDRSNDIEDFLEAARTYYALANGVSGQEVGMESASTLKSFDPDPDMPLIPEFGLAEVKYAYIQEDMEEAERILRRYDRNRDGYIDRAEAAESKWTHMDPFETDYNQDDRLDRMELGQRYARRRLLTDAAHELVQKARRTGGEIRSRESSERREDSSQWWRQGGSSYWLTASVLGRFDTNRNGRLEVAEAAGLGVPTARIDIDRNGELSREELHAYLTDLQDQAGDTTEGIPGWFYELDSDRDGQVAMAEFSEEWSDDKLTEFTLLDTNSDGLLTPREIAMSKSMMGGSYSNRVGEVLPPHKTVISEIEIEDDLLISDLNVQLSITHTNVSYLDGYLTGPDGQRIELFSEIGGSGDNFNNTIFDDQSQSPIVKAQPPYEGVFMPQGLIKRQPGLGHFTGQNAKGVWQLVIRATRSDRFGMLHNWSIIFRPKESLLSIRPDQSVADAGAATSQPNSSAWPIQSEVTAETTSLKRAAIDYEAVGKKIAEAVQSGRMTEQDAKNAWIEIKSKAGGKKESKEMQKDERKSLQLENRKGESFDREERRSRSPEE